MLSGATNPLEPFEKFTQQAPYAKEAGVSHAKEFIKIGSLSELHELQEQNRGKKIMLDFYADWCTSCKELEHTTFSDGRVQEALGDYLLVQADITENSDENKALSASFNLFGPPAILFFDENSKEITNKRVIGYQSAEDFVAHLHGM